MTGPLLLADTPHLLYRAFFALPDSITDGDGHPVNALLGSVNQLLWCEERFKPRAIVCCFGQESAHYRTELYPPTTPTGRRCPTRSSTSGAARPRSTRRSAGTSRRTSRSRPTT